MSITKYRREELAHEILNELADGFSVKEIAAKISCGEATVRRIVRASSGCSARALKRRLIASRKAVGMPDEARQV